MRRSVSILMILLWCLGPARALLPGSDESRLPLCCRRNGAHHCAMAAAAMARMAGTAPASGPMFQAPAHCPFYPNGSAATVSTIFALGEQATTAHAFAAETMVAAAAEAAPEFYRSRPNGNRGPPSPIS